MPEFKRPEAELFTGKYATIGTKGRATALAADDFRTDFQRDIHRILYSQAFRRLRHKTQVFYFPQNDHVSTRMNHVMFVASAARTVARCLGLNEDLAEAIGLAHDIGHAPFGHRGEDFLNGIIADITKPNKGFETVMPIFHHEVYGLRVVDRLAKGDRAAPGLNLTWEVRDGIISHCGEDFTTCRLEPGDPEKDLASISHKHEAGNPATLEGCIVRLIDKIAYCGKDIEDAIEVDVIRPDDIPQEISQLGTNNGQIVGRLLEDIIRSSYNKDYIAISKANGDLMHRMIQFNCDNIYHTEEAQKYSKQAESNVRLLFAMLLDKLKTTNRFTDYDPDAPNGYKVYRIFHQFVTKDMKDIYDSSTPDELIVLDFLAGMTDGFVSRSFRELFIFEPTV